ncbi:MAG: NtaA/DmoA family FMN-dependent monooxygenase [Rhodospirillales bacterium]|nr:NtaA/DmoA family FMN-dependent monooxygenase [Rhodospirillales bacterium]
MAEQIHLNAFTLACPSPQFWGAWKLPNDESAEGFLSLDYWIKFAGILERGKFDALFFADTMGVSDVYGGSEAAALRNGVFAPAIDPTILIAALAGRTSHLGFAVTFATSHAPPYHAARLFSSLDHVTKGRVAWNIVTSTSKVNEANGLGPVVPHDERYDIADEYLEVCYKLWEQSWEDGALRLDREAGVLADPDGVHRINHRSEHFSVRGPHQTPPSPQRTPFLYQAGGSPRGMAFAGHHAEAVFLGMQSPDRVREMVDTIRGNAAAAGRDPKAVKILMGFRCLVGESERDVRLRRAEMEASSSAEAALAMYGYWTGHDLGSTPDGVKLGDLASNDFASIAKSSVLVDNRGDATVGDLKAAIARDGNAIHFAGTARQVADQMEELIACGLDGFNIVTGPVPAGYEEVVDLLVPELQRRGLYRSGYRETVLRERYLGKGQKRLRPDHPGARFRRR